MSGMPGPARAGEEFACRRCGHCCSGRGGIVVSARDRERLCAFLGCAPDDFAARYCDRRSGKLSIRSDAAERCVFFKEDAGCGVHAARPDICRAWPYFRGNLVDEESLELARDFCPGIPQGQPHGDFVREGMAYLVREKLMGGRRDDEAAALQVDDLLCALSRKKRP